MANKQISFGLITQYLKIHNSIFILIHKLNRSIDFLENTLENNNSNKEKLNVFFIYQTRIFPMHFPLPREKRFLFRFRQLLFPKKKKRVLLGRGKCIGGNASSPII